MILNNLSEIMGRKKLKITTISLETGITRPTLTSLYYGNSKAVTLDVLNKLCAFLSVSPGYIFTYYPVDIDKIDIDVTPTNNEDWAFIVSGQINFVQKNLSPARFSGGFTQCKNGDQGYNVSLGVDGGIKNFPAAVKNYLEQTIFDKVETAFLLVNPDAVVGGAFFNYYD